MIENRNVRTDCYLSVLKKYKNKYPEAHFEVITRTANSVLAPSWDLLSFSKLHKLSFNQYKRLFLRELNKNPKASDKIKDLRKISKKKTLFLVCYEKDPKLCHRSIIANLILN